MWMWAFRALMGISVLGCIAASATFAFEFGWTRGATEVHRWTYALAGVALDVIKAGLPIFGAMAWHESKPVARTRLLAGVHGAHGPIALVRLWYDGNAAGREVARSGRCQHGSGHEAGQARSAPRG